MTLDSLERNSLPFFLLCVQLQLLRVRTQIPLLLLVTLLPLLPLQPVPPLPLHLRLLVLLRILPALLPLILIVASLPPPLATQLLHLPPDHELQNGLLSLGASGAGGTRQSRSGQAAAGGGSLLRVNACTYDIVNFAEYPAAVLQSQLQAR